MDVELEEYTQYQETKLHEKPGFAYETYLCTPPPAFHRANLPWHDEVEVVCIKQGRGTESAKLERSPGEAGGPVPGRPGARLPLWAVPPELCGPPADRGLGPLAQMGPGELDAPHRRSL